MSKVEEIKELALELPPHGFAQLATWVAGQHPEIARVEQAWEEEIGRRVAEVERSEAELQHFTKKRSFGYAECENEKQRLGGACGAWVSRHYEAVTLSNPFGQC